MIHVADEDSEAQRGQELAQTHTAQTQPSVPRAGALSWFSGWPLYFVLKRPLLQPPWRTDLGWGTLGATGSEAEGGATAVEGRTGGI